MELEEFEDMDASQMLREVKKAIQTILIGGQSYKIGTRQLTRADLAQLRALRRELEVEIGTEGGSGLPDHTVVAVFDRR